MLSIKPLLLVVAFLFAMVVRAENTVMDMIQNNPQLSSFNRYLNDPANVRLYNLLSNSDTQLTVFAPWDDAFDELNQLLMANARVTLTENQMRRALNFHVIPDQSISTRDLAEGFQQYSTLYDTRSSSRYDRRRIRKMRYDIPQDLSNGLIIYGKNWNFDIFRGLGAPARIVKADIHAQNGVIHIIDRVLVPPLSVRRTLELRGLTRVQETIRMANAADTFQSLPNVTILIPNNEAVRRFTASHPNINQESLRNILLTHVIPGYHFSMELSARSVWNLPTQSGEMLRVSSTPGRGLSIGDATITKANILTENAVLHVIDRVLVPQEFRSNEEEEED